MGEPAPLERVAQVFAARAEIHAAALCWPDDDAIRLAALLRLGRPATVVDASPGHVAIESGEEKWGTRGLRAATTPEARTRADVLHAWRQVSALCGHPLPPPHALEKLAG